MVTFTRNYARQISAAPQSGPSLKHIGKLGKVYGRGYVHLVAKRAPVVHGALHSRFRHGRAQDKLLNLGPRLVHPPTRLDVDVVNGPAVVSEG